MSDTPAAPSNPQPNDAEPEPRAKLPPVPQVKLPKEVGGAPGPEPTRYGDWQHKGRCTDF